MRKGRLSVAAADLSDVKRVGLVWSGFVHSEKTGNENYQVQATFSEEGKISSSKCTCRAREYAHTRCKHQAALLFAVLALVQHGADASRPVWARRPGVDRRLKGASASLRAKVGADMSWPETIAALQAPTPRHLTCTYRCFRLFEVF